MTLSTRFAVPALFLSMTMLGGCTHENFQRNEGVSAHAGNAIAANTAMQIVDPWPEGVEDTDLKTPAERTSPDKAAADTPQQIQVVAPKTTE